MLLICLAELVHSRVMESIENIIFACCGSESPLSVIHHANLILNIIQRLYINIYSEIYLTCFSPLYAYTSHINKFCTTVRIPKHFTDNFFMALKKKCSWFFFLCIVKLITIQVYLCCSCYTASGF